MTEADRNKARLKAALARAEQARNFPHNTCAASRHLHIIAEALAKRRAYPMLTEEPEHCAESILATIAALWELRTDTQEAPDRPPSDKGTPTIGEES